METLQPSSLSSLSVCARIRNPGVPWSPIGNVNHHLWKPRERERTLPLQQEDSQGKKRSIHSVNGTLFLPVTRKRKGTFPSGSGERKGPLWGRETCCSYQKRNTNGACETYKKGRWTPPPHPSIPPSILRFEGTRWRHFKSRSLKNIHLFPFLFFT